MWRWDDEVGFRETLNFCHPAELVSSILWSNDFKILLDFFVRCFLLNTLFPIKPLLWSIYWATKGVLQKKVLLKISQDSQENTCVGVSFLIKLQDSGILTHLEDCFFCSEQMWLLRNGCIMKYYYFVNEFDQINQLLFFLKSSDNYRFSHDFRGNRN